MHFVFSSLYERQRNSRAAPPRALAIEFRRYHLPRKKTDVRRGNSLYLTLLSQFILYLQEKSHDYMHTIYIFVFLSFVWLNRRKPKCGQPMWMILERKIKNNNRLNNRNECTKEQSGQNKENHELAKICAGFLLWKRGRVFCCSLFLVVWVQYRQNGTKDHILIILATFTMAGYACNSVPLTVNQITCNCC